MGKRDQAQYHTYQCPVTERSYKLTRRAPGGTDELLSVEAWYEMHPDEDDRPEHMKKKAREPEA